MDLATVTQEQPAAAGRGKDYEALLKELRSLKLKVAEIEDQLLTLDNGSLPQAPSSIYQTGHAHSAPAAMLPAAPDTNGHSTGTPVGSDGAAGDSRSRHARVTGEAPDAAAQEPTLRDPPLPEAMQMWRHGEDRVMDTTRVVMHQIVLPADCDHMGICIGGQVLSWIDICAGLSAKTLAKGPCVTVSVDAVHFLRPCRLGTVVIIAAMVNRTFSSSMEVGVRVESEDMRSGVRHHCCSAYLTFVSLRSQRQQDGDKAQPLPRVVPTSGEHRRIHYEAEQRRSARLAQRQQIRDDPELAAALAACRLQPVTHRTGCPTLPPAITLTPASAGADIIKRRVPPGATTAYMTQSVMPQNANSLGITFGGQIMRWMEQCAYISASRLRGTNLLTASMDAITIARSTNVGDILYITAQVTAIFETSLEVMISVFAETPKVGAVFHVADAYATVVVVDDDSNPQIIPFELDPHTPTQRMRYEGALKRREERLAMREALLTYIGMRPSLDGTRPSMEGIRPYPLQQEEAAA